MAQNQRILLWIALAVTFYVIFKLRTFLWAGDTAEHFEIPSVISLPPFPEFTGATPMTLIALYKGQNEKLATDLRSLGLPESYLENPANYPSIISALKRLNLLPT